jgi:hypothetical protein
MRTFEACAAKCFVITDDAYKKQRSTPVDSSDEVSIIVRCGGARFVLSLAQLIPYIARPIETYR